MIVISLNICVPSVVHIYVEVCIYVYSKHVGMLSNSDILWMGAGGLKLWEGSLDLITALTSEMQHGRLSFNEKRVLEVGA